MFLSGSLALRTSHRVDIPHSPCADCTLVVCHQIARALAIFHVDEVVLYGDPSVKGGRGNWDPTHFFARLLQYVETPQYLRKVRHWSLQEGIGHGWG